jgi:putative FmdB family regulatory protein
MGVPFYEYRRPDGTTFEVMQKMSDDPLTHDPETGVPVERVFSPIAIHFKGKGFYNTDYGTKKRNREKASEKSASSANSSSGSSDSSSSSGSSDSSSSSSSSDGGAKTGSSSSTSSSSSSSSKKD